MPKRPRFDKRSASVAPQEAAGTFSQGQDRPNTAEAKIREQADDGGILCPSTRRELLRLRNWKEWFAEVAAPALPAPGQRTVPDLIFGLAACGPAAPPP